MIIRDYEAKDEIGWVRCRTLAFLQTSYFDNVLNKKDQYEHATIELVAEVAGQIVGLIDVEYEKEARTVCTKGSGLGGMIWHIAVHPDFYRRGIGESLLKEAENRAIKLNVHHFEAWTRDDQWVRNWYEKMDFQKTDAYYHIYFEGEQMDGAIISNVPQLYVIQSFAHYTGDDVAQFSNANQRLHECICYEKYF